MKGRISVYPSTCHISAIAEPPRIVSHPKELRDVSPGKSVTFTIEATGTKPLSYQWQWRPAGRGRRRKDWQNLFYDGSLFQELEGGGLELTRVMACNAGYYRCIVSNCAGSETSQSASLTVGKQSVGMLSSKVHIYIVLSYSRNIVNY